MTEVAARDRTDLPSRDVSGSPPFRVVIMDRSSKGTYLLVPQLLEGIRHFELKYGDATRAQTLVDGFESSYCSDQPFMPAAVVVDPDGRIVGHGLASIEYVLGTKYLYVAQIHKQKDTPREMMLQLMQAAIGWAQAHGIERLLAYPGNETLEALFIDYGMQPIARTLSLDLRATPFGGEDESRH